MAAGILALWIGGVLALNANFYSPSRFVTDYLEALAAGQWGQAIAQSGEEGISVAPEPGLLDDITVTGWQHVSPEDVAVQADYLLDGEATRTVFVLHRDSRILGLFDQWVFATPPTSDMTTTAAGFSRVQVNDTSVEEGQPTRVLVPGVYRVEAATQWLGSSMETLALSDPGRDAQITLNPTPSAALEKEIGLALQEYLSECSLRGVLQPASCPFGTTVDDRLVGQPEWTITVTPTLRLTLSPRAESVSVVADDGVATVTGTIQSLFDGSLRPLNRDIVFAVVAEVTGLDTDSPALRID